MDSTSTDLTTSAKSSSVANEKDLDQPSQRTVTDIYYYMLSVRSRHAVARLFFWFGAFTKKGKGMPPLPAFSDKLLQPRSKPDDPLTDDQIGNFDKYYRKRTKVESVNVKSNKPVIRLATQRKDVA